MDDSFVKLKQCVQQFEKLLNADVNLQSTLILSNARMRSELVLTPDMSNSPAQSPVSKHLAIMSQRQSQMLWYIENLGIIGLAHYIMKIALEEDNNDVEVRGMRTKVNVQEKKRKRASDESPRRSKRRLRDQQAGDLTDSDSSQDEGSTEPDPYPFFRGHVIWKTLYDDCAKGAHSIILYYLASMPLELIKALICGDLPLKMQETDFRLRVGPHLKLKQTQGIYAVYVSTSDVNGAAGHAPSLHELLMASDVMRTYCDLASPNSAILAQKIDVLFGDPSERLDYTKQRRYAGGKSRGTLEPILLWLKKLDEMIQGYARSRLVSADRNILSLPLSRSLTYVGLSKKVCNRAMNHSSHVGTSSIFGLFTSTLRYLYDDKYDTLSHSYQILHTASFDHVGLDEILIATLASAHWWDGGLNRGHAGTSLGSDLTSISHEARLLENFRVNRISGCQKTNIEDSRRKIAHAESVLQNMRDPSSELDIVIADIDHIREEAEKTQTLADMQELIVAFTNLE